MRERGALGRSSGARGELDVDRLVELQRPRQLGQPRALAVPAHRVDALERDGAGRRLRADLDHHPELRQLGSREPAWGARPQLRRERVQHSDVVAGLERGRGDQRAAADLVQRVFQLRQPIGRVDVDQHQSGFGGGELRHHPFRVVGRPDADALPRRQAQREQAGGEGVHLAAKLGIGPAHALLAHDQPRPVAPLRDGAVEIGADRLAQQGLRGRAMHIARGRIGHESLPCARHRSLTWRDGSDRRCSAAR